MAENPTVNHNLDRPLIGSSTGRDSENWGTELNENFTTIDNKLVIVDQESNRGNYTPIVDGIFYAIDTGRWYYGDGNSWTTDDTTGPTPTFESLTVTTDATVNGNAVVTDGTDTLSLSSLTSETVNGTEFVNVGSDTVAIQAAIDAVADHRGSVALDPSQTYTISSEINLKSGVTLYCNNADLNIDSDTNGIFCDTATTIHDLNLTVTADTYSSDAIVLDGSRTSNNYGSATSTQVRVNGNIAGINDSGAAIALRATSTGNAVGIGNTFTVSIEKFDTGILAQANDSWINGSLFYAAIGHCRIGVDAIGDTAITIYGVMQPHGSNSDIGIRNQNATTNTITWYGDIWDPPNFNQYALSGTDISLFGQRVRQIHANNSSDGSANQIGLELYNNSLHFYDFGKNKKFSLASVNNNGEAFQMGYGGTGLLNLYADGEVRVRGPGMLRLSIKDPANNSAQYEGELTVISGSNTSSGNSELAVGQSDGSWITMSGEVF